MPASTAPRYPPIGAAAPKIPMQKFRILPGGNVTPIMATELGRISAPPMPVNPRTMLKDRKDRQPILMNVHTMNHAPPSISMFLWPYTEPIWPVTRMNVPSVSLERARSAMAWQSEETHGLRITCSNPVRESGVALPEILCDLEAASESRSVGSHLEQWHWV